MREKDRNSHSTSWHGFGGEYWQSKHEVDRAHGIDVDLAGFAVSFSRILSTFGPKRVLDVGCGDGSVSRFVLESGAISYLGTDPSSGGLRRSLAASPVGFIRCDGGRLPLKDSSFDLVLMIGSLHHGGWPMLSEAGRVVRDRGLLLIIDHAILDSKVAQAVYKLANFTPGSLRRTSELSNCFLDGEVPETLQYSKQQVEARLAAAQFHLSALYTRTSSTKYLIYTVATLIGGLAPAVAPKSAALRSLIRRRERVRLNGTSRRVGIDYMAVATRRPRLL